MCLFCPRFFHCVKSVILVRIFLHSDWVRRDAEYYCAKYYWFWLHTALLSSSTPFHARNNKCSLRNQNYVSEAITKLLISNFIEEIDQAPCSCRKLQHRLILDLRQVYKFIKQTKFRYENLNTLSEMIIFTSFDLKSRYHHIEINLQHHKFLWVQWTQDRRTRFFHFNVIEIRFSWHETKGISKGTGHELKNFCIKTWVPITVTHLNLGH